MTSIDLNDYDGWLYNLLLGDLEAPLDISGTDYVLSVDATGNVYYKTKNTADDVNTAYNSGSTISEGSAWDTDDLVARKVQIVQYLESGSFYDVFGIYKVDFYIDDVLQNNMYALDSSGSLVLNNLCRATKLISRDSLIIGENIDSGILIKPIAIETTSNATPTVIWSEDITEGQVITVRANITASSGTERAEIEIKSLFYRDVGGDVTQEGSTQYILNINDTTWTADFTVDVVNQKVELTITGAVATNIKWFADVQIKKLNN